MMFFRLFLALFAICCQCESFIHVYSFQTRNRSGKNDQAFPLWGAGFGKVSTPNRASKTTTKTPDPPVIKIKQELVDLIPRMTGRREELSRVEELVNEMEFQYQPPQTLSFANLLMEGEWQLLFSTNLGITPNPSQFRLREVVQRIVCSQMTGNVTNTAVWDWSQNADANFDRTGTFQVRCHYEIKQQGATRMGWTLDGHVVKPAPGSPAPSNEDVPTLVGLLYRALPKELFDPTDHATDTTYMDGDLRVVRYTGAKFEGVRDIFIRRGSMEIRPE